MTRNSQLLFVLLMALVLGIGGALLAGDHQPPSVLKQLGKELPSGADSELRGSPHAPLNLPAAESSAAPRSAEVTGLEVLVALAAKGQEPGGVGHAGELFALGGERRQAMAMFLAMPHSQELPLELLKNATRYAVTSGSSTVVPIPNSPTLFVAKIGDAVGAVLVDPALTGVASMLTVTALLPRATRAQVTREDKQPQQGARVILRGFGSTAGEHETELKADHTGQASFYHLGALAWHGESDWTWDVQALWGQSKSYRKQAMGESIISTRPILKLRESVDVTMLLVDERGELAVGADISLMAYGQGLISLYSRSTGKITMTGLKEGLAVGVLDMGDLGKSWAIEPASFVVASGEEPSQTVHLRVRFDGITLSGLLVHEDQTPFAEGEFTLWSDLGWPSGVTRQTSRGTHTTDEMGAFAVPIEPRTLRSQEGMASFVEFTFHYLHGEEGGLSATSFNLGSFVATPLKGKGRRVDLGEVVLAKPSTLFRGRVVDPKGNPIAGAKVQANASRDALEDARPEVVRALLPVTEPGSLTATTDDFGHFELAYNAPASLFQIKASYLGAFTEVIDLEGPRSEALLLTIQPNGVLEGRLAPSWKAVQGWSVKLSPASASAGQVFGPAALGKRPSSAADDESMDTILLGTLGPELNFNWSGVPVGTYDLVFHHDSLLAGEEFSIRGVRITEGEYFPDARLEAIDLDAVKPTVTVELTQSDGPAIPKQSRTDYTIGTGTLLENHRGRRGSSYSFLPTALPVAVRIETQGFEPVDLVAKGGVVKVSLVPLGD
ncbi:MAG: hypothetical protein ACI8Q9_001029 [Planctomycetota bacterium]|jgi:hypothetical protein